MPRLGIHAGCNFAVAATLCNLISGISVILYTPPNPNAGSGKKFKELLVRFYPWETGENSTEKTRVLYHFIRNPLTHSLGMLKPNDPRIRIEKDRLEQTQIDQLERSTTRPGWVPLAGSGGPTNYSLSVGGLYCGVFNLLRRLANNSSQMQDAEQQLAVT